MCGFAGFLDIYAGAQPAPIRQQILHNMGQALSLRGPDDEQLFLDDQLALVFRRLSIVDLRTGQQPIWNEDRSLFIVVNGEIYNHHELRAQLTQSHQFRTRSDAEVVLHLYEERGPKVLDLLIGMFAIAIWDTKQQRLFLARDRMGVKPLFVHRAGNLLLFGSELKALLCHPACPRELRWSDIDASLHQVPSRRALASYIEDIEQLPGGHYAIYQDGKWAQHRYWSLDEHVEKSPSKKATQYIDEYASLIEDSVQKRLMSDVPVGAFLSGGLDSSLLVAIASRSQQELHCFHALEKTVARCGDTTAAQSLAALLKLPLHPVRFEHRTLVDELGFDLSSFERFIWLFDSPRFHLEWLFKHELHRYAKTINPSMKVMLIGQGADEFSGGYSQTYGADSNWARFEEDILHVLQREIDDKRQLSLGLRVLMNEPPRIHTHSTFHEEMLRRVGVMQNFNLWHEDRSSAAQGMESRVPFLDHRLLELLASVPASMHRELFDDKHIIRQAARRWLPEELTTRPKVGFFLTHDQSSIHKLSQRILRAVYPDFEEKYLRRSGALFSQKQLRVLYERSLQGGAGALAPMDKLFGCMAIEVFRALCQAPPSIKKDPRFAQPSLLVEGDDALIAKWSALPDEETAEVGSNDEVSLEPDIKVSRSLDGPLTLYFLRGESVEQEIEIGEGMEWVASLVEMLQRGKHSVSQLASLGAPEDELQETLRYLMSLGLVYLEETDEDH